MASAQSSSSSSRSGSTSQTRIVPGMMAVYNQLLGLNQQNYQNLQSGYGDAQQRLASQLNTVYQGYGDIETRVMKMLGVEGGGWGVATPAANAIRQQATQAQGSNMQNMINAGLGNTTVLANLTNQNSLQTNQAYGELGSKLADYAAGYAERIGLARQQAMLSGAGMQSQLASGYLSNLAGYQFQNTAGNLLGTFSRSWSESQSQASGVSQDPIMGGYGRGGYGSGGRGSTMNDRANVAYDLRPLPGLGDLTPFNYQAQRAASPYGYGGSSTTLNLSSGYGGNYAGSSYSPTRTGGGRLGVDVSKIA